jgi:ABC-type transport system involved in multi-copper enzyme maturation permease subunit
MLKTLIIKEIQENITSSKTVMAFLICVIIIPLALFVSNADYEKKKQEFQQSVKIYREMSKDQTNGSFRAQAYRPPSPLSVLAKGLEDEMPDKVVVKRNEMNRYEKEWVMFNPMTALFGKIDFVFIVVNVLSLLAFMFSYNCISGERESGTMKMIMSNAVPRWKIILSKITGNFILFIMPFIVGVIMGLLFLIVLNADIATQASNLLTFGVIMLLTILFLLLMFVIGVLFSVLFTKSASAMIALLLVWLFLTLVIPRLSPMIAEVVYPVKSEKVIIKEKELEKQNIDWKYRKLKEELMAKIAESNGMLDDFKKDFFNTLYKNDPKVNEIKKEYSEKLNELKEKESKELNASLEKIDNFHQQQLITQGKIAASFSMISPIASYSFLCVELSGTGMHETDNLIKHANQFSDKVIKELYDKFEYDEYYFQGSSSSGSRSKSGKNEQQPVPEQDKYSILSASKAIMYHKIELAYLLMATVLIFAFAVFRFIKIDVR